jgi:CzcA family heavy metal efflux pump
MFVIVAGLCVWGIGALWQMPSAIYPPVAFPRIAVIAERGEDSVENMMVGVTRPVEQALAAVPQLARMRSKTTRGASEIALDFREGTNMPEALGQVRAKVAETVAALPPGVETTVEQQTPSIFPIISFNVLLDPQHTGRTVKSTADLSEWASLELKPRLSRIPDVFLVSVQGGAQREILVEADPVRLAARGLSLDDVSNALKSANTAGAVGLLERDYRQYQILVSNQLTTLDDVRNVPVPLAGGGSITVGQLGRVSESEADRTKVVTGNGTDAVVVSIFMRYGGKITELSDNLQRALNEMRPDLPPGVSFTMVYDQANLVRESMSGVRDAILIGSFLAGAVLLVFLSSWRVALLAALSIPLTVASTLAFMHLIGMTLNLMSLGGMAISIGLVIDNAIVVVENIVRRLGAGGSKRDGIAAATHEIFGAVVGSSLTSVVIFLPLVLLEGVVGQFFRSLSITLGIAILVSMAVSLAVLPVLALGRMAPAGGQSLARRWTIWLADNYGLWLERRLRSPWLAAAGLVIIAGAGALTLKGIGTGFLPEMDEGGFVLDYSMPVGSSLTETDRNCRRIEQVLRATPEVASFSRRTGAELGLFATEQFTGDFLVGLKPASNRKRSASEVIDDLRGRIGSAVPQIEIEFVQVLQDTINDLAGNPAPIEVKILGTDYRRLQALADAAAKRMEGVRGAVDIKSGVSFGSPEILMNVNASAAQHQGLSAESVQETAQAALLGRVATQLRAGERLVPIRVRYPDSVRFSAEAIGALPLPGKNGSLPLRSVVSIEEKLNPNELVRENQQPMVTVTANVSERDLGSVASDVHSAVADLSGPGVRIEIGGQVASQREAFRNLLLVLALAVGAVFLLLVAQFRSYRLPIVIFLALPYSQFGALALLRLTHQQLNVSSFMGLVMLVGLVVKNGIILIECFQQLMAEGEAMVEAAVEAAKLRLRPILMTSLAAILGLLPLALNLGAGAELQRPLALAVIGGLSVSTVFTLLAVPVGLVLFGRLKMHATEDHPVVAAAEQETSEN